jgi:hypothetical protein
MVRLRWRQWCLELFSACLFTGGRVCARAQRIGGSAVHQQPGLHALLRGIGPDREVCLGEDVTRRFVLTPVAYADQALPSGTASRPCGRPGRTTAPNSLTSRSSLPSLPVSLRAGDAGVGQDRVPGLLEMLVQGRGPAQEAGQAVRGGVRAGRGQELSGDRRPAADLPQDMLAALAGIPCPLRGKFAVLSQF